MMNDRSEILLWYIEMIAAQGTDTDGTPYFDGLYLALETGERLKSGLLRDISSFAEFTRTCHEMAVRGQ